MSSQESKTPGRTLPVGTQEPLRPVACPSCGTYSVGFESADYHESHYAFDIYRCINGHRWIMAPNHMEGVAPAYLHNPKSLGLMVSDRSPVAIRCPKCGHEAAYRGWRTLIGSANHGPCVCLSCGFNNERHPLKWPEEAYYQCEVDGKILWAWSRGYAAALKDFLASDTREPQNYPGYEDFLFHVPKDFLLAKHRDIAVRRLSRLLGG
jgi:predicted RNA-binding Zn-ribbon protein involved in translation (DUF1610 family)